MRSAFRVIWRCLPLAFAAALLPVYVCYLIQPAWGYFHDDGVYIVNALSLVSGSGYRTVSLPSPLFQTKYPILYPALLSLVWKVFPAFPENVLAFKSLSMTAGFLWAVAAFRAIRREPASAAVSFWSVLCTFAAPWTIFLGTSVLPDTLFALLSVCSILILEDEPESYRKIATAAAVAGCTFLLRSAGVALIVSACLFLVAKRRVRCAALFLAISGAVVSPWLIWQATHSASLDRVESYYTKFSYAGGHIFHYPVAEALRVVSFNVPVLLGTLCPVAGSPATRVHAVVNLLAGIAAVLGLIRFRSWSLPIVWTVVYCAMLLCWTWPPPRYLTAILPFAFMCLFNAIEKTLLKARPPWISIVLWTGVVMAGLLYVITNALSLSRLTRLTLESKTPVYTQTEPDDWSKTLEVADWIRSHTPANAIVAANCDPVFYLLTQRKSIRLFSADQFELFYDPDPAKQPLGGPDDLRRHLKLHQVQYLVMTPMKWYSERAPFEEQLHSLLLAKPQAFTVQARTSDPNYYVLKVDPLNL